MFGLQNCTNPPNATATDAGVAGAGVLLSFIITAALAILLSGIIILHELRLKNEAKIFRKLLQSLSDQQIITGIGIQCVGLAKLETMVPYHFFLIWMLSLLSTATHLSTLLALVNDFKRDWVLRWLRQFLMFVNLVLSCVFGIFVLMATMKDMAPTLAVPCVWQQQPSSSSNKSDRVAPASNAALSIAGTIAVMLAQAAVFALGVWYLHSRSRRCTKLLQTAGLVIMIAIAIGATIRIVTLSQAFGTPNVALHGVSEADWGFGQLWTLLLLLLPCVSAVEIMRGVMGVPGPVTGENGSGMGKPLLLYGRSEEQDLFQPNPFWGGRNGGGGSK